MHDYSCSKGSSDNLNETASIVKFIQIGGKQKKVFWQIHFLLFFAKWREEKGNWLCYSPNIGKVFYF